MKRIASLVTALAVLILAASVSAAPSRPTLVASPNPAIAGQQVNVSGCGYIANKRIDVIVTGPVFHFYADEADSDGCISLTIFTAGPGEYLITSYKYNADNNQPANPRPLAETTLQVV